MNAVNIHSVHFLFMFHFGLAVSHINSSYMTALYSAIAKELLWSVVRNSVILWSPAGL